MTLSASNLKVVQALDLAPLRSSNGMTGYRGRRLLGSRAFKCCVTDPQREQEYNRYRDHRK